jgi:aspartyl-tRNA(Asn)/glutamyl-tRNA(Gln) amidotransferase subunit B
MNWEVVVGIETHAQLLTRSKIFSAAATAFGAPPNTQASAVDLALPGVLPVLNRAAVEHAIRFGLAVGATINRRSTFARKNYFYPDLPKGYQISQYEQPIVQGGTITIAVDGSEKKVRLTRAHLEEDAGKSIHGEWLSGVAGLGVVGYATVGKPLVTPELDLRNLSGIDFNRAGTPLLEIVSEPDLSGAKEAVAYARALHSLVVWIGICDGNMEEGSFRCDANVSVRRIGEPLGTRCELKNLNSFRFLEHAINFEARRQIEILEDGGEIVQETRLYDPERNETRSMRTKEEAHDYRYFPDPDLLPLIITEETIERIRAAMPELPEKKRTKFREYGVPAHTATTLTGNVGMARFFESMTDYIKSDTTLAPQTSVQAITSAANTAVSSLSSKIDDWVIALVTRPDLPREMALIEVRVAQGKISSVAAKEVREGVLAGKGTADQIIQERGLEQIADASALEKVVDEVLKKNEKQVNDYKAGKEKAFNSLVGQVMKASGGKASPAQVNEILRRKLGS